MHSKVTFDIEDDAQHQDQAKHFPQTCSMTPDLSNANSPQVQESANLDILYHVCQKKPISQRFPAYCGCSPDDLLFKCSHSQAQCVNIHDQETLHHPSSLPAKGFRALKERFLRRTITPSSYKSTSGTANATVSTHRKTRDHAEVTCYESISQNPNIPKGSNPFAVLPKSRPPLCEYNKSSHSDAIQPFSTSLEYRNQESRNDDENTCITDEIEIFPSAQASSKESLCQHEARKLSNFNSPNLFSEQNAINSNGILPVPPQILHPFSCPSSDSSNKLTSSEFVSLQYISNNIISGKKCSDTVTSRRLVSFQLPDRSEAPVSLMKFPTRRKSKYYQQDNFKAPATVSQLPINLSRSKSFSLQRNGKRKVDRPLAELVSSLPDVVPIPSLNDINFNQGLEIYSKECYTAQGAKPKFRGPPRAQVFIFKTHAHKDFAKLHLLLTGPVPLVEIDSDDIHDFNDPMAVAVDILPFADSKGLDQIFECNTGDDEANEFLLSEDLEIQADTDQYLEDDTSYENQCLILESEKRRHGSTWRFWKSTSKWAEKTSQPKTERKAKVFVELSKRGSSCMEESSTAKGSDDKKLMYGQSIMRRAMRKIFNWK